MSSFLGAVRLGVAKDQAARIVSIPGSKSIANRGLIIASLARGQSVLRSFPTCDDVERLLMALRTIGIRAERCGADVHVMGTGGELSPFHGKLDFAGSGTGLRFFLALSALLPNSSIRLDGEPRMRERPMGELITALRAIGVRVEERGALGCVPLDVTTTLPPRSGAEVTLSGAVSSQFVSALLMVGPCFKAGICMTVAKASVSSNYIELTTDLMRRAGVSVRREQHGEDGMRYEVPEGSYQPLNLTVEPDASSATYLFALAALRRSALRLYHMRMDSHQPDIQFLTVLSEMGCSVISGSDLDGDFIEVSGPERLRGGSWNLRDFPDSAMTLSVLAACADSPSRLDGLETLPLKESNRLLALQEELLRIGVEAQVAGPSLLITPQNLRPCRVQSHGDHRMAMAFAVLALRIPGLEISQPEVVAKSFPEFWEVLQQCGVTVESVSPS